MYYSGSITSCTYPLDSIIVAMSNKNYEKGKWTNVCCIGWNGEHMFKWYDDWDDMIEFWCSKYQSNKKCTKKKQKKEQKQLQQKLNQNTPKTKSYLYRSYFFPSKHETISNKLKQRIRGG